jgi:hypothetical protein
MPSSERQPDNPPNVSSPTEPGTASGSKPSPESEEPLWLRTFRSPEYQAMQEDMVNTLNRRVRSGEHPEDER